jgi:hypothetical protein
VANGGCLSSPIHDPAVNSPSAPELEGQEDGMDEVKLALRRCSVYLTDGRYFKRERYTSTISIIVIHGTVFI